MIKNEVIDAIHARRSTRSFLSKEVENEKLETLLDAAAWAPSGSNSQSWLFTAVTNKDALSKINELLHNGFLNWTPDDDYPAKKSALAAAQEEDHHYFYNAPALIIASNKPNYANAMADCSLALENIFLAAQSIGLGSCYINQLHWLQKDPGLREYLFSFGIPKEHVICNCAAVGYIAKPSAAPKRKDFTFKIVR